MAESTVRYSDNSVIQLQCVDGCAASFAGACSSPHFDKFLQQVLPQQGAFVRVNGHTFRVRNDKLVQWF